jgi:hypothetical protein
MEIQTIIEFFIKEIRTNEKLSIEDTAIYKSYLLAYFEKYL